MIFSWVFHGFFMVCSWFVHDFLCFFMFFSCFFHVFFMLFSCFFHAFFMVFSCFFTPLLVCLVAFSKNFAIPKEFWEKSKPLSQNNFKNKIKIDLPLKIGRDALVILRFTSLMIRVSAHYAITES